MIKHFCNNNILVSVSVYDSDYPIKRSWMKEACMFDSEDAEFTFCRLWAKGKHKITPLADYGVMHVRKK